MDERQFRRALVEILSERFKCSSRPVIFGRGPNGSSNLDRHGSSLLTFPFGSLANKIRPRPLLYKPPTTPKRRMFSSELQRA